MMFFMLNRVNYWMKCITILTTRVIGAIKSGIFLRFWILEESHTVAVHGDFSSENGRSVDSLLLRMA